MATSLKAVVGTFFKRAFNPDGSAGGEKVLMLPKTLARFVYNDRGESIEHHQQATDIKLENVVNGTLGPVYGIPFDTMKDYQDALAAGTVTDQVCVVLEDTSDAR